MKDWFPPALLTMVCWGFGSLLPKLALRHLDQKSIMIYRTLGTLVVSGVVLSSLRFQPKWHPNGALIAAVNGVLAVTGYLFYLNAMSKGKVSVIVTMTALYPVVTVLLALLVLKESISGKQIVGLAFAVVAIVLFST